MRNVKPTAKMPMTSSRSILNRQPETNQRRLIVPPSAKTVIKIQTDQGDILPNSKSPAGDKLEDGNQLLWFMDNQGTRRIHFKKRLEQTLEPVPTLLPSNKVIGANLNPVVPEAVKECLFKFRRLGDPSHLPTEHDNSVMLEIEELHRDSHKCQTSQWAGISKNDPLATTIQGKGRNRL